MIKLGRLLMLLPMISGCSFTNHRVSLTGNYEVKQLNHAAVLQMSREPIVYSAGYIPNPDYHSASPATCFILNLVGEPKDALLESVRGSYQYNLESSQPLVATWIGHNQAVLYPTSIIGAEASQRPDPRDNLKYGRYKLDISYRLNGHEYKCNFNVKYSYSTVFEYHDIRELRNVN
jgi:hypothetical protein